MHFDGTMVQGTCDGRFSRVKEVFVDHFDRGLELGASVAVQLEGRWVVDLWAGCRDREGRKPWLQDTIVNVFSVTKGVAAACVMQQVERGVIDLDAPVAKYWPEFAQAGKEDVRVRHILTHQSGLIGLRSPVPSDAIYDHDGMAARFEREAPFWKPGTESHYHARSFGWLLEELLRRTTQRLGVDLIRQGLCQPLGLDFQLGLGPELDERVADLSPKVLMSEEVRAQMLEDPLVRAAHFNPELGSDELNSRRWRATPLLSSAGHTNARALASFYGSLARTAAGRGGIGNEVLDPNTIKLATTEQCSGHDKALFTSARRGLGFLLSAHPDRPGLFGHNGYGGSYGGGDLEHEFGFGYTMNRLGPALGDNRVGALTDALYECL